MQTQEGLRGASETPGGGSLLAKRAPAGPSRQTSNVEMPKSDSGQLEGDPSRECGYSTHFAAHVGRSPVANPGHPGGAPVVTYAAVTLGIYDACRQHGTRGIEVPCRTPLELVFVHTLVLVGQTQS